MKKILIATTALAFASSAFAADVTGYAITAYQKSSKTDSGGDTDEKALYAESEVGFSGSKMGSNGITFGATFTVGQDGPNGSKASYGTDTTDPANPATEITNGAYSHFKTFISGGFGKLTLGRQNVAAREIGAGSLMVGLGPVGKGRTLPTRKITDAGITYLSPKFAGIQFAYTLEPDTKGKSSLALRYTTKLSGVGLGVAYGSYQGPEEGGVKPDNLTAYAIKIDYSGFGFSYGTGSKADGGDAPNQIGLSYDAGKFSFGYVMGKNTEGAEVTTINLGYTVTSGLDVFLESASEKTDDANKESTLLFGTNISF